MTAETGPARTGSLPEWVLPSRFSAKTAWEKEYCTSEGVGFEPTVRFPVRLISSQVPSTAQPPFLREAEEHSEKVTVVEGKGSKANGRGAEVLLVL